jgi:hypothetical protein
LNIKTSEIVIPNVPQESFLRNLKQRGFRLQKSNALDKENHFYIDLRIPIRLRGQISYLFINSKLVVSNKSNGILLRLYANINKLILVAILGGSLPSTLFLYMHNNVLLFFYSAVFIALSIFIIFVLNILKLSNAYLQKFKENASNLN